MSFFTEELKKIISLCPIIKNPAFIGQDCIFRLTDNITAKLRFQNSFSSDDYDVLEIRLLNRNEGPIDTQWLYFRDVIPHVSYTVSGQDIKIQSRLHKCGSDEHWYGPAPKTADYKLFADAVAAYLNCFADTEQTTA